MWKLGRLGARNALYAVGVCLCSAGAAFAKGNAVTELGARTVMDPARGHEWNGAKILTDGLDGLLSGMMAIVGSFGDLLQEIIRGLPMG